MESKESVIKKIENKEENNKYDHIRKRSKSPQRNRNKYGEQRDYDHKYDRDR